MSLFTKASYKALCLLIWGGGDKPISGLTETKEKSETNRFVRKVLTFMVFLPPITILLIVAADVLTLLIASYLRPEKKALVLVLYDGKKYLDMFKIIFFEAIALVAFRYTLRLCIACRAFSHATSDTICEFQSKYCKDKQDLGNPVLSKPSRFWRFVEQLAGIKETASPLRKTPELQEPETT